MAEEIKWFEVYRYIAEGLADGYRAIPNDYGAFLFKEFRERDPKFSTHTWVRNLLNNEWGEARIDPIQIFASISGSSLTLENKHKRISFILSMLNGWEKKHPYEGVSIDFTGCPMPPPVRLTASRDEVTQRQIWEVFDLIMRKGGSALRDIRWTWVNDWYGVGVRSMTLFFFWIDSAQFIPLDKNTLNFLRTYDKLPDKWQTKTVYTELVKSITEYDLNPDKNERDGSLFREITRVAYEENVKNKKELDLSDDLWAYLELDKLVAHEKITEVEVGSTEGEEVTERTMPDILRSSNYFKLIALETLPGCKESQRKRLEPKTTFVFNQAFEFSGNEITYFEEREFDLFTPEQSETKYSISAIVGKNGAGKSTLVEFLLKIINNIAWKYQKKLKTEKFQLITGLKGAVYYQSQDLGRIRKISVDGEEIMLTDYIRDLPGNTFIKQEDKPEIQFEYNHLWTFFYSVVVNYSLYSFNSSQKGSSWLNSIMHKNDGYQAPAVIAPMRTKGNIDINKEESFAVIRLLSNLFEPVENGGKSIRNLADDKLAYKVDFKFEDRVLGSKRPNKPKYQEAYEKIIKKKRERSRILKLVYNLFDFEEEWVDADKEDSLTIAVENYIVRKLIKISAVSNDYIGGRYFDFNLNVFRKGRLESYLKRLMGDPSHNTTKLKQAINYLRFPDLLDRSNEFTLIIEQFAIRLQNFKSTGRNRKQKVADIRTEELMPPPIFEAKIFLLEGEEGEKKAEREFEALSSGEKQRIHAVSTVLYHLRNLDSVRLKTRIGYTSINLILDEIELYYHPDYQRTFLDYLLNMIYQLPMENISGINILFATHSPYILSDIPHNFVLKLEKGAPDNSQLLTLGANIHDLLRKSFFMRQGVMGEFAREQIKDLIRWLRSQIEKDKYKGELPKYSWAKEKVRRVIDAIGEPMIQTDLNELYAQAFLDSLDAIDLEIARLEKLKAERKKKDNSQNGEETP